MVACQKENSPKRSQLVCVLSIDTLTSFVLTAYKLSNSQDMQAISNKLSGGATSTVKDNHNPHHLLWLCSFPTGISLAVFCTSTLPIRSFTSLGPNPIKTLYKGNGVRSNNLLYCFAIFLPVYFRMSHRPCIISSTRKPRFEVKTYELNIIHLIDTLHSPTLKEGRGIVDP